MTSIFHQLPIPAGTAIRSWLSYLPCKYYRKIQISILYNPNDHLRTMCYRDINPFERFVFFTSTRTHRTVSRDIPSSARGGEGGGGVRRGLLRRRCRPLPAGRYTVHYRAEPRRRSVRPGVTRTPATRILRDITVVRTINCFRVSPLAFWGVRHQSTVRCENYVFGDRRERVGKKISKKK